MQQLSHDELNEIECALGVKLPGFYRELLTRIGHGRFGQKGGTALNTTREIYHPTAVRELYEPFFDDAGLLFAPYFPFGCNNETQELWIIDDSLKRAASIWHETVPDDWSEEEWLPFDVWELRFLDTFELT